MIPFTESLRYEIPNLTLDSVVLDIGSYEGNWGRIIAEKYGCQVHFFEPIFEFYQKIEQTLASHPRRGKMTINLLAVSDHEGEQEFTVKGDMSGEFADAGRKESVVLIDIVNLLRSMPLEEAQIGAMKLNCEGSEFVILEALLKHGMMDRIDVLHVQPHTVVPDYQDRWVAIMDGIAKTHDLIFNAPWCWVGWERRK